MKEKIEQALRATGKENIEALLGYMDRNGFYTQHCHSHHHYEGGLAEHAWQTMLFALRSWETDCQNGDAKALATKKESIVFAAILHDICDIKGLYHHHGHGRRSAAIIHDMGIHMEDQEYLAVRFHMSLRNKKNHRRYSDACHSYLRNIVHKADGHSAGCMRGCEI